MSRIVAITGPGVRVEFEDSADYGHVIWHERPGIVQGEFLEHALVRHGSQRVLIIRRWLDHREKIVFSGGPECVVWMEQP